jgi:hypothetical protein
MNALELADQLTAEWNGEGFQPNTSREAAAMLRRQYEYVKTLREALEDTTQTLVWMQWGDCRKFTPIAKLLTTHEAVETTQAALAATEEING